MREKNTQGVIPEIEENDDDAEIIVTKKKKKKKENRGRQGTLV